jgi:hypothetical protein
MAVRFGEIDASQIVENEYRIGVLEGIVDWILANNSAFVDDLTPEVMDGIRQRVGKRLQDKYPKTGIAVR